MLEVSTVAVIVVEVVPSLFTVGELAEMVIAAALEVVTVVSPLPPQLTSNAVNADNIKAVIDLA